MTAEARCCPYCGKQFLPSPFRPAQAVCSSPDCQRRRQTDFHRRKYRTDPEYRQVCRDSDGKWRALNPDYQRQYRQNHPDYVDHNRHAQRHRDRRRRLQNLVKNNLAFDLKTSSADVWLVGPELEDLVKNNLAISEVLVFQTVGSPGLCPGPSCKEHPPVLREGPGL